MYESTTKPERRAVSHLAFTARQSKNKNKSKRLLSCFPMQLTAASEGPSNVCPIQFLSAIITSIILRACKCENAETLPRQHLLPLSRFPNQLLFLLIFKASRVRGHPGRCGGRTAPVLLHAGVCAAR